MTTAPPVPKAAGSPAEIARRSKSNLAIALACLPRERRRDMQTFYAFCRMVDDIADHPGLSRDEKSARLARWSEVVESRAAGPTQLEAAVASLPDRYPIPRSHFHEIIAGVSSDLDRTRYESYADLQEYCYHVAGVVGLVSVGIFGCRQPQSREYAVELGYALQLTNILRDLGADLAEDDRLYLPLEDLRRFEVTEADLRRGARGDSFLRLMNFEADRAAAHYQRARDLLPPEDARTLAPAEAMRQIYSRLLAKMRTDRFRVFSRRYRLSGPAKMWIVSRATLRHAFAPRARG